MLILSHIEGVWGVDIDALRIASASHDRTVKVWDRESGNCVQTLVGHRGAVTSLQLSDDMIVSGSGEYIPPTSQEYMLMIRRWRCHGLELCASSFCFGESPGEPYAFDQVILDLDYLLNAVSCCYIYYSNV